MMMHTIPVKVWRICLNDKLVTSLGVLIKLQTSILTVESQLVGTFDTANGSLCFDSWNNPDPWLIMHSTRHSPLSCSARPCTFHETIIGTHKKPQCHEIMMTSSSWTMFKTGQLEMCTSDCSCPLLSNFRHLCYPMWSNAWNRSRQTSDDRCWFFSEMVWLCFMFVSVPSPRAIQIT